MTVLAKNLHHCKYCDTDRPAIEMRRDSSYASGFRPQCLDCKAAMERRGPKPKPKLKAVNGTRPKKVPPEDRLWSCSRCERDDIPFVEMSKDKRKFMGVAATCLKCRRTREAELRVEAKKREGEAERARLRQDDWVYCWRCNTPVRPGNLRQPPPAIIDGYPEGVMICSKCAIKGASQAEIIAGARARLGLPANPTRKQLESAARVAALRDLAKQHEREYRVLYTKYSDALGVVHEKAWISL